MRFNLPLATTDNLLRKATVAARVPIYLI